MHCNVRHHKLTLASSEQGCHNSGFGIEMVGGKKTFFKTGGKVRKILFLLRKSHGKFENRCLWQP